MYISMYIEVYTYLSIYIEDTKVSYACAATDIRSVAVGLFWSMGVLVVSVVSTGQRAFRLPRPGLRSASNATAARLSDSGVAVMVVTDPGEAGLDPRCADGAGGGLPRMVSQLIACGHHRCAQPRVRAAAPRPD